MEKTIEIDGQQVTFKYTAATPLRYKAQFQSDYFADMLRMYPATKINMKDLESGNIDSSLLSSLDFEVFYNILWAMAKTANKSIPDPITWLDEFDEFPIMEIIPEVQDLLEKGMGTKKKLKAPKK